MVARETLMKVRREFFPILLTLVLFGLALAPVVGQAQQTGNQPNDIPPGVSFTVRLKDGKTQFYQGELITVEMQFSSDVPNTYRLDAKEYDRSGHLEADSYHIEPETGTSEPLRDYLQSTFYGGSMGGLMPRPPTLQEKPYIVTQTLNDFVRFDRPGKYRLYITNDRVGKLDANQDYGVTERFKVRSNTIELEILPATREWQQQRLREAIAIIDGLRSDRRVGCRALRFLNTPDAEAEMIRGYRGSTDGCDGEFNFGLLASPRRESVIFQMEASLQSPSHPVTGGFVRTLALLVCLNQFPASMPSYASPDADAGKMKEWQTRMKATRTAFDDVVARYAEMLSSSMPRKEKAAQAVSIDTLFELQTNLSPDRRSSTRANETVAAVPEVFLDLPVDRQYALLTFYWPRVRSPAMLRALKQLIQRPSGTANDNRDLLGIALYRFYELAPDEGRQAIIKEIKTMPMRVRPQILRVLPDESVPEVDSLVAEKLAQGDSERDFDVIADYARLIARYATATPLPQIKRALGNKIGKMACNIQSPLLAYLLRVEPAYGSEALDKALRSRQDTGCYQTELLEVARIYMSPEIRDAALRYLDDSDVIVSIQAAAVISQYGMAADEPLLWDLLQRWHDDGQTRNPEVNPRPIDKHGFSIRHEQVGLELLRSIARGRGWLIDEEKFNRLQQLCVTKPMLDELSNIKRDSGRRDIDVSTNTLEGNKYFRVAQYEFPSLAALKEKLLQYPKTTVFALKSDHDETAEEAMLADLRAFLVQHDMKVSNPDRASHELEKH